MMIARLANLILCLALLAGCGGGGSGGSQNAPPPQGGTYTATSGVAQKGPLQQGSTVTAQELDTSLSPTGKQYTYQITSNFGTFAPTSTFGSQYIGLTATGYYFDEITNSVSSGPITLNGYSDLTADPALNVNLLTTLAYQRIQTLLKSNMTFAAARSQAETEVLAAFNIRNVPGRGSFDSLDLTKGSDGDNILTALSTIFVYGNTAGNLSALIANVQSDIGANGTITNSATRATLAASTKAIDPVVVAANLTQEYAAAGVRFSAANISDWIDQDGDGVVGRFKFEVSDASQTSAFTFPSFVIDSNAGTAVTISVGQLAVNGTVAAGAVTIKAGDVLTVEPPANVFPDGVVTAYLSSGVTKLARVTFVRGLASIAVTPQNPSLQVSATQQFVATGTFTDGSTADISAHVVWASTNTAAATVSSIGIATGVSPGSTAVTAASAGVSGATTLTVIPATLQSIAVAPNPFATGIGIARQLTATGTYSDGTTANLTTSVTWTSSNTSMATVTGGMVTGVAVGSVNISAMLGAVSGTASLIVSPNNTWSAAPDMQSARSHHSATLLPNGKVFVVGSGNFNASSEIFDPVANGWAPAASRPSSLAQSTATLLGSGKVLVAGGTLVGGDPSGIVELYDPATDTWSSVAGLSVGRVGHTAVLLASGKVLVSGGSVTGGVSASAEIYDPVANSWSPAANMTVQRIGHTATLLANNKVLVAGGSAALYSLAELYDPSTDTWSSAGNLAVPRVYGSTASLLPNGKVLIAGGVTGTQTNRYEINDAELYDPVANTWSTAAPMAASRSSHTATVLSNGIVLVTGGHAGFADLRGCEVYW